MTEKEFMATTIGQYEAYIRAWSAKVRRQLSPGFESPVDDETQ
jgi:hypothetical protein